MHLLLGACAQICLFSQGVNGQQTLANATGKTGLQEAINSESLRSLEDYTHRFAAYLFPTPGARARKGTSGASMAQMDDEGADERCPGKGAAVGDVLPGGAFVVDGVVYVPMDSCDAGALTPEGRLWEMRLLCAELRNVIESVAESATRRKDTRVLTLSSRVVRMIGAPCLRAMPSRHAFAPCLRTMPSRHAFASSPLTLATDESTAVQCRRWWVGVQSPEWCNDLLFSALN